MWSKTVDAIKTITGIKERRQGNFVMQRLRKGREVELEMDVKDVQKNISLIRSPAAGLKERREKEMEDEDMLMDTDDEAEENITYVDARVLEKQLAEEVDMETDRQKISTK